MTSTFSTLPFEEQLRVIARAVERGEGTELIARASELTDPEPLARLLERLADAGRLGPDALEETDRALRVVSDASLCHVFAHAERGSPLDAHLRRVAERALTSWRPSRPSALAYLVRWLRRRDPEAHRALRARALDETTRPPGERRWLLFVDGARLAELGADSAWGPLVDRTVAEAVEALARAPKSISQVNAERLLARRVYADPGHFLFELLQNADDAGATSWTARVEPGRAQITNDGAPFSFLDLVGVLSIGQTTKAARQIGFFGVGFKSVYEVCERPRVHSGAFDVEIAHVSIPRIIGRPADHDATVTRLVLPFRPDVDVAAIAAHAGRIPPETLMTLPNLTSLGLEVVGSEPTRWREESSAGQTTLRSEAGETRAYWRAERQVRFDGEREEGRPVTSRVLVVARVDHAGAPVAAAHPTLFAFLPTAERTGLRALVHARFDVTLDRERIELGSPWNAALLAAAGEGLGELARRAVAEDRSPLPWIAAPSEASDAGRVVMEAARGGLVGEPCLPGADGAWVAPRLARRLPEELASALAGVDLGGGARALAPLTDREAEAAGWLGAEDFTDDDLVALCAARLVPSEPAPGWLGPAVLAALGAAAVDDARLRELPLVEDPAGRRLPASAARRAPASWARLYDARRPVVSEAAVARLPEALRERLAVARLPPETLVDDLRGDAAAALIAREPRLLAALEDAPDALLANLTGVPILRGADGERRAIADGLVRTEPWLSEVAPGLAGAVPLVAEDLAAAHPTLVARWVPAFGLRELADAIDVGLDLAEEARARLAAVLDERAARIGAALARRLGRVPLFADRAGSRRPLLGAGRALIPAEPALMELLPAWPWLAAPEAAFAASLALSTVGPPEVATALATDDPEVPAGALEGVLAWLAARAPELSGRAVEALADAPIWLDVTGAARHLSALRRGGGGAAVTRWYAAVGGRAVAHPASLRLLSALRIEERLPESDHAALIDDLVRAGPPEEVERALLCEVLEEAAVEVSPRALAALMDRPLFEDEAGELRPLASWARADKSRCHRPGAFRAALRAGPWPLLSEADERRMPRLLGVVAPRVASVSDLVARLDRLVESADHVLDALLAHASELTAQDRAELAAAPLFEARSGARRPLVSLVDPRAFEAALGSERLRGLGLDDAWLSDEGRAHAERLGLSARDGAALLTESILPELKEGERLAEARSPWNDVEALWALAELMVELGVPVTSAPVGLDAGGRLRRGPLRHAPTHTRALVAELPIGAPLADEAWARGAPPASVTPLGARAVAEALRAACPEERPRADHPTLPRLDPLYAWLRDEAEALANDDAARSAFGAAAVIPSQRGTLRAPREMVLDPTLPDLGLDWGVAPDVPEDIARWLGGLFELDRAARRRVVEHTLDGIDAAAEVDDRARAAELLRFLASALGAATLDDAALAQRARRSKTRARLKVPVEGGGWDKPRFAWAPDGEVAEHVRELTDELPPRIALPDLDAGARRLLAACGARGDLDDDQVDALLDGDGLLPGLAARRALARYVAVRALEVPARVQRWRLHQRAWVPDRADVIRQPGALLWPDELAEELFGGDASRFPDAELCFGLSAADGARLGFASADALTLSEVASGATAARAGLLAWLEDGLRDGRFSATEVRRALAERLLFTDDAGVSRPPRELARAGASELFGPWRGDVGAAVEIPRLADALGIPPVPDAKMIVAFLADAAELAPGLSPREEDELARRLPRCLERLAELAADGVGVVLPEGGAVAASTGSRAVVTRLGDPRVRLLEPDDLAEALPEEVARALLDPLPTFDRDPLLRRMLWAAGVPDLWSAFRPRAVAPGPERTELAARAEELRGSLARVLKDSVGARARVVEGLVVEGVLAVPAGGDYRSTPGLDASTEVDAVVLDGTLFLTPDVLREPERLAPALALEPRRRAGLAAWLAEGRFESAPRRVRPAEATGESSVDGPGLWDRIKRLFGGDDEGEAIEAPRARRTTPRRTREDRGPVGESFFRPEGELRPQLESTDGWLDGRRAAPDFGFAFTPARVAAPWLYAPKLVATRFDRRGQRWRPTPLARPDATRREVGVVSMRGALPRGDALLPVPLYARLEDVRADGASPRVVTGPGGTTVLRLDRACEVRLRLRLTALPDLDRARAVDHDEALASFVPDDELPDEVHALLDELDPERPPIARALTIRDFVRERYRYDPSYLEDAAVGRWLAKVTRGRANAHVAALHAASDARYLGAGVCYELNVLACELMRRAGVPAAVATGWVLDGGSLSEPDHLWAIALLEDDGGAPAWIPIDASATRSGRPLRVPRRPAGRFKKPREKEGRAPKAPRWNLDVGRGGGQETRRPSRRARRPPRAALHRLLNYLERAADRPLDPERRAELERALTDRRAAARLLARLEGRD